MTDWRSSTNEASMTGSGDGTIETARLRLRPMRDGDVDDLLGVFGDPTVMTAFGVKPFGRVEMERWLRRTLDHQERHGYGLFAIILKTSGQLIGDCGLERMELDGQPETELGYDVRSDHWGRGLATEAATAVRDHAFATLALPRLVSLIRRGNDASRRVAEKVGMRLDRDLSRDGTDYWLYAVARSEVARRLRG
jgi:RimJ/RimL family protein N-acetyltransferase